MAFTKQKCASNGCSTEIARMVGNANSHTVKKSCSISIRRQVTRVENVSHSTRKGAAIMASGVNLFMRTKLLQGLIAKTIIEDYWHFQSYTLNC